MLHHEFAFYVKSLAVLTAWVFAQLATAGELLQIGFDEMFSLGLLILVLIVLYKEYKSSIKYNADRDIEIKDLLEKNIESKNKLATALDALVEAVSELKRDKRN